MPHGETPDNVRNHPLLKGLIRDGYDFVRQAPGGVGDTSDLSGSSAAILETGTGDLQSKLLNGSVAASDAFFPFRDGLDAVAAAGATAVVQPGGSVRDAEVIAAADAHDIAMLFTGIRHFRH